MAQGYLAQVQALIAERMKENPEEMKRKLKEIEEAKKKAKEAPKSPPKPSIDPQLTQELIEELNKDSNDLDFQKVKDLIKRGADIKAKTKYEATVLHWASHFGDMELAKECLQAGIDVDSKDNNGVSPLYWAVYKDNVAIAELLISAGADVNCFSFTNKAKDKYGNSSLKLAIITYMSDDMHFESMGYVEMKALLKKHGAK
jgi:ankyrin repeat protein